MKKVMTLSMISLSILAFSCNTNAKMVVSNNSESTIQVALLLDTSNSMDGLIEQAKSRLWNIVNTLTTLKYNGQTPKIQIALYEYGNDGLSEKNNWVRQVTPLTQDLDLLSEKLFRLKTNGGSEYVGAVVADATKELKWDDGRGSMKLIYIAGNEPFNQGKVSYKEAISDARRNNIYVNTIYCGDIKTGIESFWKDGAVRGQGKYFAINSDEKVKYVETPYDSKIAALNDKLNATYIGYGRAGNSKKMMQAEQDNNAAAVSASNSVERVVSKSKTAAYSNSTWDVVDRYKEDKSFVQAAPESELPDELKGKTATEKTAFIEAKTAEREAVQNQIGELAAKRQSYIDEQNKRDRNAIGDDLGVAIEKSIVEIAGKNGFNRQ